MPQVKGTAKPFPVPKRGGVSLSEKIENALESLSKSDSEGNRAVFAECVAQYLKGENADGTVPSVTVTDDDCTTVWARKDGNTETTVMSDMLWDVMYPLEGTVLEARVTLSAAHIEILAERMYEDLEGDARIEDAGNENALEEILRESLRWTPEEPDVAVCILPDGGIWATAVWEEGGKTHDGFSVTSSVKNALDLFDRDNLTQVTLTIPRSVVDEALRLAKEN